MAAEMLEGDKKDERTKLDIIRQCLDGWDSLSREDRYGIVRQLREYVLSLQRQIGALVDSGIDKETVANKHNMLIGPLVELEKQVAEQEDIKEAAALLLAKIDEVEKWLGGGGGSKRAA